MVFASIFFDKKVSLAHVETIWERVNVPAIQDTNMYSQNLAFVNNRTKS